MSNAMSDKEKNAMKMFVELLETAVDEGDLEKVEAVFKHGARAATEYLANRKGGNASD